MDANIPPPSNQTREKKPRKKLTMEDTHVSGSSSELRIEESQQFSVSQICVLKEVIGDLLSGAVVELKELMSGLIVDIWALRSDMDIIHSNSLEAEHKMDAITTMMQGLNKRVDIMQTVQRQDRNDIKAAIQDISSLQFTLAELQDRNRRSNLHLIGLSEEAEKDDAVPFLQANLPKWLPALATQPYRTREGTSHIQQFQDTGGQTSSPNLQNTSLHRYTSDNPSLLPS
ncbi:UNVERIFIED_CONTAM: hypothetical protein FKN15_003872 [Acipenser sinensis]